MTSQLDTNPLAKKMCDIKSIVEFIIEHFDECSWDGGVGTRINIPDTQLSPQDFLEFAEKEIDQKGTESLLNCISHLKRAVDCEIDRFLHAINVFSFFSKNNLGFPNKLEAIRTTGMFNSKSLDLLNSVRNRLEHEYAIPEIVDLQVYYELCNAFIMVLESHISDLAMNGDSFEWCDYKEDPRIRNKVSLSISFNQSNGTLKFDQEFEGVRKSTVLHPSNKYSLTEYLLGFKVFFTLSKNRTFLSDKHALKALKEIL